MGQSAFRNIIYFVFFPLSLFSYLFIVISGYSIGLTKSFPNIDSRIKLLRRQITLPGSSKVDCSCFCCSLAPLASLTLLSSISRALQYCDKLWSAPRGGFLTYKLGQRPTCQFLNTSKCRTKSGP